MILTKEKARNKICPMKIAGEYCVEDMCMGWREIDGEHGYCGIAGLSYILTPTKEIVSRREGEDGR